MNQFSESFDPIVFSSHLLKIGHAGWLGMAYHAHGDNWFELELPWREDLVGDPELPVLASGPIISLLDMASGMCIWITTKRFVPIATLDLRVDYQRPARDHTPVIGRAECYRVTRSAAFIRGIAHDGDPDDPVANMAAVFMNVEPRKETAA